MIDDAGTPGRRRSDDAAVECFARLEEDLECKDGGADDQSG
jgi:hypothetical protein